MKPNRTNLGLNEMGVTVGLIAFLVFGFCLGPSTVLQAMPACPDCTVEVVQPDGITTLVLRPYGDERNGRMVTQDGYTVTKGSDGWYTYAVLDTDGRLTSSNRRVLPSSERSPQDVDFLSQIGSYLVATNLGLHPDPRAQLGGPNTKLINRGPRTTNNILVILIDYPDEGFTFAASDFNNLLNQNNYGGVGSVNDYYMENSYGAFGIAGTDVGWYTAANNRNYYGYSNGWVVAAELAKEAVQAAIGAGVNFAPYDNDGNGEVDGLFIVHAGPGAEAGFSNYPWSHKWSLTSAGLGSETASGKLINTYTMEPEKYNATQMSRIGVYCHEYGHALGLPDLYDTDGSSIGIGDWCLMASGSWNGPGGAPGQYPAHMSAWCKVKMGWITPTNVYPDLLAQAINDVENNSECFRLWTTGAAGPEYFLVEYRKQVLFDTELPGCGIAIWHIDDNQTNNTNDAHRWVDLEEMDNTENNSAGDLWLSTNFNGSTTPNSNSYAGAATLVEVNVISSSCVKKSSVSADLKVGAPGSPVEIYIKDCDNDVGTEPDPTSDCPAVWGSPDIYIDNDADGLMDPPAPGLRNRVFWIARNIGPNTVSDATLEGYFVNPAMGIYFPSGTPIEDMYTKATTFNYPPILPAGNQRVMINWEIPAPPPSINHYCVGAVLNCTGDAQTSTNPRTDNNVAQINMSVFYQRAGQTVPPVNRINEFTRMREDSATIFHSIIKGCNPIAGLEFFVAAFDDNDLEFLPPGWFPYIENPGPHMLTADSCVDIHVYMVVENPQHNDSALVNIRWALEINPNNVVGGFMIPYCIDDHAAAAISNLEATALDCPPDDLGSCPWVRLDWPKPLTDEIGEDERIRWYYIYCDSIPDVGTSDVIDSIAVDIDLDIDGFQWYDYIALANGESRYYRVASVDGAFSRSELGNMVVVSASSGECCDNPGDANDDNSGNVGDAVYLINYVFKGGPGPICPEEGDANYDCSVNVGDAVYLITYIFKGGPPPECGCVE